MNLIVCGILTTLAVVYCVLADETVGFNMMMCVSCVVAIACVWTQDNNKQEEDKTDSGDQADDVKQE